MRGGRRGQEFTARTTQQIFVHHGNDEVRAVDRIGGKPVGERLIDRHRASSARAAENVAAAIVVGGANAGEDAAREFDAYFGGSFVYLCVQI